MASKDELILRSQEYAGRFKPKPRILYAVLGDGAGNIDVTDRPGWAWVRIGGETGRLTQAINKRAPHIHNYPISVGYEDTGGRDLHVLGVNDRMFPGNQPWDGGGNVAAHATSHQFPDGADIVWLQKQQLVPLLARPADPADLTVVINADYYETTTGLWDYYDGETFDFTALLPASGSQIRALYLNRDDGLVYSIAGPAFPSFPPVSFVTKMPTLPAGVLPIAAIFLNAAASTITFDQIFDIRMIFGTVGAPSNTILAWIGA